MNIIKKIFGIWNEKESDIFIFKCYLSIRLLITEQNNNNVNSER